MTQITLPKEAHQDLFLPQLLSEMDGFLPNEGVVVLGATNRAEDLDKALLRPGRFDTQVVVPIPDMKGRKEILTLYLVSSGFSMMIVSVIIGSSCTILHRPVVKSRNEMTVGHFMGKTHHLELLG